MKTGQFIILLVLTLLTASCAIKREEHSQAAKVDSIIGTWHLASLNLGTNKWPTNRAEFPNITLHFKTNGTYESTMIVEAGTNQVPVPGGDKWFFSNGLLHITGTSMFSHSNLVMQVQISDGKLIFEKDPVVYPYTFKSVYERVGK